VKKKTKSVSFQPEQFFSRAIVTRIPSTDGSEEVTLKCGHSIICIVRVPADAMYCPECVNVFLATKRGAK
jgi:hypothetical protein